MNNPEDLHNEDNDNDNDNDNEDEDEEEEEDDDDDEEEEEEDDDSEEEEEEDDDGEEEVEEDDDSQEEEEEDDDSQEEEEEDDDSDENEDEDDQGNVLTDDSKITQEVGMDEEDEADDSLKLFTGHTSEVYTVACSPRDPTLVATGGRENQGFIWRMGHENATPLEIRGLKGVVSALAFSSDGKLLASGNSECSLGLIHIWDAVSGVRKTILRGPVGGIEWVKWHPLYHYVLAGSEDCSVWMWNAQNGYGRRYPGHGGPVTCGDFTPDGKILCTGSDDATLRIWSCNPATGRERVHIVKGQDYHTKGLTCLSITSDSSLVITGSKDGTIKIVNITTRKVVSSLDSHCFFITCLSLAPSYPWLASGSMDKTLIIWDLEKNNSPLVSCTPESIVTCMAWIGASHFIATGSVDGKVRIWNSFSGDCVTIFRGHKLPIQELSVSSHKRYLVSVSLDGTARVFEVKNFHFRGIEMACRQKLKSNVNK